MPTQVSKQVAIGFEKLKSGFRFSQLADGPNKGQVKCEVIDRVSSQVYASAIAPNEEDAAAAALKAASGAERPQTPAQLAQENMALKARVAELEAGQASAADSAAQPSSNGVRNRNRNRNAAKAAPPPDAEVVSAESQGDDEPQQHELTTGELVTALKSRKLEVPPGDRRTKEWRAEALEALDAYDKAASK